MVDAVPSPAPAEAEGPMPVSDADPRAVAVPAAPRRVDPRLVLSGREIARPAQAVDQWPAVDV